MSRPAADQCLPEGAVAVDALCSDRRVKAHRSSLVLCPQLSQWAASGDLPSPVQCAPLSNERAGFPFRQLFVKGSPRARHVPLLSPGLHSRSCPGHNSNGTCDEGSGASKCLPGTDCSDCGPHPASTSEEKLRLVFQSALLACPSLAPPLLQAAVLDCLGAPLGAMPGEGGGGGGVRGGCDASVVWEAAGAREGVKRALATAAMVREQLRKEGEVVSMADAIAVAGAEALRVSPPHRMDALSLFRPHSVRRGGSRRLEGALTAPRAPGMGCCMCALAYVLLLCSQGAWQGLVCVSSRHSSDCSYAVDRGALSGHQAGEEGRLRPQCSAVGPTGRLRAAGERLRPGSHCH